jgi:hypothetical protein
VPLAIRPPEHNHRISLVQQSMSVFNEYLSSLKLDPVDLGSTIMSTTAPDTVKAVKHRACDECSELSAWDRKGPKPTAQLLIKFRNTEACLLQRPPWLRALSYVYSRSLFPLIPTSHELRHRLFTSTQCLTSNGTLAALRTRAPFSILEC